MEEEQPATTKHHSGMTIGGVALMVIGILLFIIAIGILIYDNNQSIQATWWIYLLAIIGSLMLIMATVLFIMAHSKVKKASVIEQHTGIQEGEQEDVPFVTTPEQQITRNNPSTTHTLITKDPQGSQVTQNLQGATMQNNPSQYVPMQQSINTPPMQQSMLPTQQSMPSMQQSNIPPPDIV